ncbi:MAG: PKD domain-containing protein [Bacteroidetes bacterium]|nr:PKD domain-containing protein [Bacteroidota bacterium]
MSQFKPFILTIAGIMLAISAFTQDATQQVKPDTADYPYWIEMMEDPSVNLYDVQKAFNTYWEGREITKGCGWKPFKRWEWWMEQHIYPDGSRQEPDKVFNEYYKYLKTHLNAKSSNADWVNLGPIHIPGGDKGYKGLGRINAVAFHPTDPDIVFIGAPSGGLWKTEDAGGTWTSTTDNLPTLGVSSMIVDWNNPDNILIGRGDRDAGDATGMGVFRSTDGGQTWEIWNTGMGNYKVGRMIQHPADHQLIYAATGGGIYKTVDGGAYWQQIQAGGFKDIVFKPGNTDILYAVSGGNFYKSTDAGDNWEQITNGLPGGSRGVIAVTPDNPEVVYMLLTYGDSFKGLYKSFNGGTSFSEMSTAPNIMSWGCTGGSGGQAWYDLDIAADPNNENIIYAGGVNCFKSENGGITWEINSHWWGDCGVPAVHADLHVLEWNHVDGRLYAGNDGGIYWTDDGGTTWIEITDGIPISQVYRIGQCRIVKDKVINGYQDNGTSTYYGNDNWQFTYGGDGMECAFDHTDAAYSYATLYYGDIFRLYNNGSNHKVAGEGVHGMTESGGWITPFCLHETNSNVMFGGYKNIWRADAIKTNNFTWKKLTDFGSDNIDVVEHSPPNNDILYFSVNNQMYRSDDVMEDNPSWTNLSGFLPGSGHVREIEAHPFDENIVYISRDSKVYKSENKGYIWTDITGSLPGINMNSIAYYENSLEGLYVASDAGVYYRDASMDDWIMYSTGLPVDASINEIEIYHNPDNPEEDVIRAGTYGRGMWSSPLWHDVPVTDFEADQTNIPVTCPINFFDLSTGVPTSWQWTFEGGTPSSSTEKNPAGIIYYSQGNFDVTLTVSNSEGNDTKTIFGYIIVSETAVPEVYFIASDSITCSGKEIQFNDMSTNCPTGWEWDFIPNTISYVNGTNQNSQNPEVIFDETGVYTVSLTVTNNAGNNTLTKEDYMYIGGISIPFTDDFESGSFSTKSWTVENPDYDITWGVTTVGGNSPGDNAAWMNFFDYVVPPGPRDMLITPVLSFAGFDEVFLSFQHAYAKRHSSVTDSLIVYISNDCGENRTRLFAGGENGNGSFATHELTTDPFIPAEPEDWCGAGWGAECITIDLTQWAGQGNIQVMFESFNYFGNNLFIDNVLIGTQTDISKDKTNQKIHIFPNPTTGIVNILVPENMKQTEVSVLNLQGAEVYKFSTTTNNRSFSADLSKYGKGIYFIRVISGEQTVVEKIILK